MTNNRAFRFLLMIAFTAFSFAFFCACNTDKPNDQIDLSDPSGAQGIATAAQLIRVLEEGATDALTLNASIDLGDDMLRLDAEGRNIAINGNGFTISGNGDCILRLADGCTISLNDVTLNGGSNAIGCLGDAMITGNATIKAVANAIYAKGLVVIGTGSRLYIESNVGSGISADGLELMKDARVLANGALGGVSVTKNNIVINTDAVLDSNTDANYNALKCEGTLVMMDGSKLIVTNNGDYHGAEISQIDVKGIVTIQAKGGSKGVGLFLFRIDDAFNVLGSCTPELRFEVGKGSMSFFADVSKFPTPSPETEETPMQTAES